MDKIYEKFEDQGVAKYLVYNDGSMYGYVDKECTIKVPKEDFLRLFHAGVVVVAMDHITGYVSYHTPIVCSSGVAACFVCLRGEGDYSRIEVWSPEYMME